MSKSVSTKSKLRPWIPPGKGTHQNQKQNAKSVTVAKSKKGDHILAEISPQKVSLHQKTVDVPEKEAIKDIDVDITSLSSHSSYEFAGLNQENEIDVHHIAVLQEMKLLYVHFASLKTSYLSAHRIINSEDIENDIVNELFIEAGFFMKTLNTLFDDLEYSVSVLENTLNENQRKVEFSTVLRNKEKLLSNLLAMYEKVILIFQVVFEKQDFKELQNAQEFLSEKLKMAERKSSSQEAVITDLERRLSVSQSKAATMESYKTYLEGAKVDLEKQLQHKESQIKYLTNELMNSSEKCAKSDREDFIQIIEDIKSKAHTEKSALKKALKFLKVQFGKAEETYKNLLQEEHEKEKMIADLAVQRDQLKIQLTVVNNNVIQLKHQIEEMKIQSLKLQNEMTEKDISHKKEVAQLNSTIEDKSSELELVVKKKKKLEETVIELEDELKNSKEHFKAFKNASDIPKQLDSHTSEENDMQKDIPRLIALLQSTRETFEKLILSGYNMSGSGDHSTQVTELGGHQKEILATVNEIKKYILELKSQLLSLFQDPYHTDPKSLLKMNDFDKQFKEMEQRYKSAVKENESLKQKLKDLRNSNLASSVAQNYENHFSSDTSSDAKRLQMEVYKKDEEIARLKLQLAHREKDLENQLRESKEKLRNLEIESAKTANVVEELENTKLELRVLQKKKEEEIESVLKRTHDLQESLDKKTEECKNLEQYIQLIKVSYFRVFGNS